MNTDRFKIVPASYVIFEKDDQVLLLKRKNTGHFDGYYSVPAGHLDGKESFTTAAIREAKEEVGVTLKSEDLEVVHVMNRNELTNPEEIRERVDVFFLVKEWEGEIKNCEDDKCEELLWVNKNELPADIIPYIKDCLENYAKGVFYSEVGYS